MKRFRVIQDRDRCIGCGACREVAPGRWQMSTADGKSVLIGSQKRKRYHQAVIDEWELDSNLQAMKICPVRIIEVGGV